MWNRLADYLKLELMNIKVISEETRIRAPLLLNTAWNFRTILTGIEILDEEIHYNKRIISEMVHIKKQSYSLNLQRNTDSLDSIYFDIIR